MMYSEAARREIQGHIDVARDLIDRVEIVLIAEWKDATALHLLTYANRSLKVAAEQVKAAQIETSDLLVVTEKDKANAATPDRPATGSPVVPG
jgi:hypothetical protein